MRNPYFNEVTENFDDFLKLMKLIDQNFGENLNLNQKVQKIEQLM